MEKEKTYIDMAEKIGSPNDMEEKMHKVNVCYQFSIVMRSHTK